MQQFPCCNTLASAVGLFLGFQLYNLIKFDLFFRTRPAYLECRFLSTCAIDHKKYMYFFYKYTHLTLQTAFCRRKSNFSAWHSKKPSVTSLPV